LLRHVDSVGDVLKGRIRVLRSLQNYSLKWEAARRDPSQL